MRQWKCRSLYVSLLALTCVTATPTFIVRALADDKPPPPPKFSGCVGAGNYTCPLPAATGLTCNAQCLIITAGNCGGGGAKSACGGPGNIKNCVGTFAICPGTYSIADCPSSIFGGPCFVPSPIPWRAVVCGGSWQNGCQAGE